MPTASQTNEEYLTGDTEEMDTGKQTTTPRPVTNATSDRARSVLAGKKRVAFLSDHLHKKLNSDQDIALKQLVKVCMCV